MATDSRDKVYGLLAMMNPSIAQRIIPDYNLDYGSIFAAAAKAHVLEFRNLELLQECNPWGLIKTPTWAPDWTWAGSLRKNKPHKPYNASGNIAARFNFWDSAFFLTCTGFFVDA